MNIKTALGMLLMVVLVSVSVLAQEEPAAETEPVSLPLEQVIAKMQENYNTAETYQAQFSQELVSSNFSRVISKGQGTVAFKKPGKMRWHYIEPQEHFYISDAKTLWDFAPLDKQVYIMDMEQVMYKSFLFGMGDLTAEFEIAFHAGRVKDAGGRYSLDLVPKDEATRQMLGTVTVAVDPETFLVKEAQMTDALGNRNKLVFNEVQVNQKIEDKEFTFKVPEGVEIIRPEDIGMKNTEEKKGDKE